MVPVPSLGAAIALLVTGAVVAGVPPAVAAPAQEASGDEARVARQMLIRRTDLPRRWRADDVRDTTGDSDACPAFRRGLRAATGAASGRAFTRPPAIVASFAFVYGRPAGARRGFATLTSRRYQRCFARQLVAAAREDEDIDDVRVGRVRITRVRGPRVGDGRHLVRIRVPLIADDVRVPVFFELAHVRVGRGIAFVLLADVITPFGETLRDDLLETVEARMRRALGT